MIMLTYREYPNRTEWLESRKNSIGASEIAAAMRMNSAQTPQQLYREKVGLCEPPDLSGNAAVQYGTKAEEYLRELYKLKHLDEYEVEYHPYRVYHDSEAPYLTCTLDGELLRKSDNAKGVWECKTALIQSKVAAAVWDGQIPQKYYCQLCQQLGITGYAFAVLNAELRYPDSSAEIREYIITYDEAREDIETVKSEGVRFWTKHIVPRNEPPVVLRL